MSNNVKNFFVLLIVNFLALGAVNVVFEYFDTGDDPLYSSTVAAKNLIVSLLMASVLTWLFSKNRGAGQEDS